MYWSISFIIINSYIVYISAEWAVLLLILQHFADNIFTSVGSWVQDFFSCALFLHTFTETKDLLHRLTWLHLTKPNWTWSHSYTCKHRTDMLASIICPPLADCVRFFYPLFELNIKKERDQDAILTHAAWKSSVTLLCSLYLWIPAETWRKCTCTRTNTCMQPPRYRPPTEKRLPFFSGTLTFKFVFVGSLPHACHNTWVKFLCWHCSQLLKSLWVLLSCHTETTG